MEPIALRAPVTFVLAVAMAVGLQATPARATAPPVTRSPAEDVFARMTEAQRVGQVLMVGTPATGVSSAVGSAISQQHVGSVILTGRSQAGVSGTASVTKALRAKATASATGGVPLVVAADQEGGQVQVLQGAGFSRIPSALTQGTWSTSTHIARARTWAGELRAAGVNLDLAPVADTVPSAAFAPSNAPIGAYDREFGFTTTRVGAHSAAFTSGMRAGGVMTAVKHFPGLGRVTANTDTSSGVTDRTTTSTDPYLKPFRDAVAAGSEVVMVSSAVYTRIDAKNPAAFSPNVIGGMIRRDMNFRGVVVSDDIGHAKQLAAWSPGTRAVKFLAAGGDLVLTVDATQAPAITRAIRARMADSPTFTRQVHAAALRVLTLKQRMGLLRPNGAVRATDVDEDGAPDLVGRRSTGRVEVLRANGTGGWRAAFAGNTASFSSADLLLRAGDFDGDGHVDVLARRHSDGALLLYAGNGRGALAAPRVVGSGWGALREVVAPGDVTGDGHPDLLAVDPQGRLRVYGGNGLGGFLGGSRVMGTGWGGIDRLAAVGDFDRDGNPDLVARSASTGDLLLYRTDGRGGWRTGWRLGTGWGGMDTVLGVGDFDSDGHPDVLARRSATLYLYRGTGSALRGGTSVGSFGDISLVG
ncbi:beta-glucosidase [Pedococcus cremeus]|uniref:beta-N-acetylhexosaminidase n=1 Tax=Pedococcus cremeus TaxID=587636 RepID=A0A1H9UWK3_9MICO|nr:glycoside hydrolase family 3 N-terminal domain-containing protein [Pedococcus cremeus]SES13792.1 beta-glucosidase [Pedococcus cremeus]